jgi:hypothetical protein
VDSRIVTISLAVAVGFVGLMTIDAARTWPVPGSQQGYEPVQPIAYSHRLHAGELEIDCLYCHSAAETSRHAGIPAIGVCMNCHRLISASLGAVREEDERAQQDNRRPRALTSPEIQKIYAAFGLDENRLIDPTRRPTPVAWTRVHNLPDFVYFDHRAHVAASVSCQSCHGPVETMERVRQVEDLSMGWCVNCHRTATAAGGAGARVDASIDCVTCHY